MPNLFVPLLGSLIILAAAAPAQNPRAPQRVDGTSPLSFDPVIATDGDRSLLAWVEASAVRVARSDGRGESWSAPVRVDSDSAMNWDDVADLAGGDGSKKEDDDIPAEVQDKLLSDYERELIAEKLKKGEAAASSSSKEAATALSDEIAEMALKEEEESKREERNSPESKGELSLY